jgi:acyl-CoA thioesterase FadM
MPRIATRRLLIGDVDSAGIAFTGRIIAIAMEVLEQGFHQVGIDFAAMLKAGRYGAPMVHLEADFKQPMRHGDAIHGELVCEHIGTSSYTTRVDLVLDDGGAVAASVRFIAACVDAQPPMRSIPIPEGLRAGLERLLAPA